MGLYYAWCKSTPTQADLTMSINLLSEEQLESIKTTCTVRPRFMSDSLVTASLDVNVIPPTSLTVIRVMSKNDEMCYS